MLHIFYSVVVEGVFVQVAQFTGIVKRSFKELEFGVDGVAPVAYAEKVCFIVEQKIIDQIFNRQHWPVSLQLGNTAKVALLGSGGVAVAPVFGNNFSGKLYKINACAVLQGIFNGIERYRSASGNQFALNRINPVYSLLYPLVNFFGVGYIGGVAFALFFYLQLYPGSFFAPGTGFYMLFPG